MATIFAAAFAQTPSPHKCYFPGLCQPLTKDQVLEQRRAERRKRQAQQDPITKTWGGPRQLERQLARVREKEKFLDDQWNKPQNQRCMNYDLHNQNMQKPIRPRIYIYELPPSLLPPATGWRLVSPLKHWVETSRFHEWNPFCADFFLVPSHPQNRELLNESDKHPADIGDYRMARAFGYIRDRYPFWNRTVRMGAARHMILLPCDHGPGDCGYTRPNLPYKYVPNQQHDGTPHPYRHIPQAMMSVKHIYGVEYIQRTWGEAWELLNPASPARLVIFLTFNGWGDGLRTRDGGCLNCFQPGLDIRLPTPEGHECGVSCGLHYVFNASRGNSWYIPVELQRVLLQRAALRSPAVRAMIKYDELAQGGGKEDEMAMTMKPEAQHTHHGCLFTYNGAVRGRNNPARWEVLKLIGQDGACIVNTAEGSKLPGDKPLPSIPVSMLSSRYCFSPRGWDQGDSDRYLPSLLYGCIPVMSDRLEGMPLDEHPQMMWNITALAAEPYQLTKLLDRLKAIPNEAEGMMRHTSITSRMVPRMLYTTFEFSTLPARSLSCGGCSNSRTDCPKPPGSPGGPPPRKDMHPNQRKKLEGPASELKINIDKEEICGRQSFLGEDGSRDAFTTLMDVLMLRLKRSGEKHHPPEPWTKTNRQGAFEPRWPLAKYWFIRRSEYYRKKVMETTPSATSLLRAHPPALQHRLAAAEATGYMGIERARERAKHNKAKHDGVQRMAAGKRRR